MQNIVQRIEASIMCGELFGVEIFISYKFSIKYVSISLTNKGDAILLPLRSFDIAYGC